MSSVAVSKRIAVLTAELEALLAESMDGTAAERTGAAFDRETFKRRCAAMDHRVVGALKEVPTEELGESSLAGDPFLRNRRRPDEHSEGGDDGDEP